MALARVKPNPGPPPLNFVLLVVWWRVSPIRKNFSKTVRWCWGAMPIPVSITAISIRGKPPLPSRQRPRTLMLLPSGVYLIALLIRFSRTWTRRVPSTSTMGNSANSSSVSSLEQAHLTQVGGAHIQHQINNIFQPFAALGQPLKDPADIRLIPQIFLGQFQQQLRIAVDLGQGRAEFVRGN